MKCTKPILDLPVVERVHIRFISGMADHRLSNSDIVEHVVDLVETRVAN